MNKRVKKVIPAVIFAITFVVQPMASAEVDPFPNVSSGAEIPGTRIWGLPGASQSAYEASAEYLAWTSTNCAPGSGNAGGVDMNFTETHSDDRHYNYCVKTWRPSAEIQADIDFQNAQRAATAAAEAESKAWAEAHPGQQKCIQWGPIVHANGVSTASGGVCANPVPVPAGSTNDTTTSTVTETSTSLTTAFVETATPVIESVTTTAPVAVAPAPVQAPITSGLGGYAVIHPDGHVCGVIVATSADPFGNGGVMPNEYMGCPSGARIVFQTTPSETGNVAGWHGDNVRYDGTNFVISNNSSSITINNGTATDNSGRSWDTGTGNVISQGNPIAVIDSATTLIDTQTALTDSSTVLVTPIAIAVATSAIENGTAIALPLATPADDLDSLPEVAAEEEVSNSVEAKVIGSKTRIAVSTEWSKTKLSVTATKKGSKKKYTYRFSTDSNGDYTFKSSVNLKGFTLVLYKGSEELDRDTV